MNSSFSHHAFLILFRCYHTWIIQICACFCCTVEGQEGIGKVNLVAGSLPPHESGESLEFWNWCSNTEVLTLRCECWNCR
jgi:hypothetical protein